MSLTLFVNTYLLVATADSYLAYEPDWVAATTGTKEQALVAATRLLDNYGWTGTASEADQPLSWPRTTLAFYDPSLNLVVEVLEGAIPVRLERAVAALALHLVRYPQVTKGYEVDYDRISVGPITLENTNPQSNPGRVPTYPADVTRLVEPMLAYGTTAAWWRAN